MSLTRILLIVMAIGPLRLFAQKEEDTIQTKHLKEVIMTATRTQRSTLTLPVPVQVIEGATIRKAGFSRLNEVILEQAGLVTVPTYGNIGEGVQMQGMDAAYTMILLDGQPLVGRTAGTLDLSRISVNNVDRIEVVKGASSALYGSEALAGVINIITRKPITDGKVHLNANYKYGSFSTQDISLSGQYGKNKIAFECFGNYYASNGYNFNKNENFGRTVEPFFNYTLQPKLKFFASSKSTISANFKFYGQTQASRATIGMEAYTGNSNILESNSVVSANYTFSKRLKAFCDLYATQYKSDEFMNNAQQIRFSESFYNHWFYRPELRLYYYGARNTLTTGIGINYETLNRSEFSERALMNSEYIFSQYEWFIGKKWNLLMGFRYDLHHQYKSQFSPKLAVNYSLSDAFSIKTSIGYGYKAPDMRQLHLNFMNSAVGYTVLGHSIAQEKLAELQKNGQLASLAPGINIYGLLRPESSVNVNFGLSFQKNNISFSANVFYNTIYDLIITRAIAQKTNGQSVFSYFNRLGETVTTGVECSAAYSPLKQLNISAGYQYLESLEKEALKKLKNKEVFRRDPTTLSSVKLTSADYFGLFNRSKHTANFKINYNILRTKTNLYARVIYRSPYLLFDTNGNAIGDIYDTFVKGYALVNLAITQNIGSAFSLQLGAENLLGYRDPENIPNIPGRILFFRAIYQI